MYGYRPLKDLFNKNKWTILIITWTWAIVTIQISFSRKRIESNLKPPGYLTKQLDLVNAVDDDFNDTDIPAFKVNYYDVMLSSYMRGGSTLSGIVLGYRDDAFYLYEPLWKIARWNYWKGNSTLCRSDRYDCRQVEPGSTVADSKFYDNKESIKGSLVMAKKILRKFYDCQFNDFERQVLETNIAVKLGGPSWKNIKDCISHGGNKVICLHKFAPRLCKQATHRVAKVLRLSTDLLGPIFEARNNFKAFHLFRDPRAIINSRINTKWYPTNNINSILNNAKGLCDRMLHDFREGKKLLEKYPDRFKFLFYEDMNEEPFEKVKAMYRFVGMSLNEKLYPRVKTLPVFTPKEQQTEREKNTAYWWRISLDWKVVQGMDDICADVYNELGYKSMKDFGEFRNLSISSVNLDKRYLLDIG